MSTVIVDLYVRAGIEAAHRWGVTPKTQIMFTTARGVRFPKHTTTEGLGWTEVVLEQFCLPNGAALEWGYCVEADVLILRTYEG